MKSKKAFQFFLRVGKNEWSGADHPIFSAGREK
jgi:hypothetical protein